MATVDQDAFLNDLMLQSAVLYRLAIVGEACRRISQEFRETHPEVEWRNIIGLRNRVVHQYEGVLLDTVWIIVRDELPELVKALEVINPPEPDGEEDGQ